LPEKIIDHELKVWFQVNRVCFQGEEATAKSSVKVKLAERKKERSSRSTQLRYPQAGGLRHPPVVAPLPSQTLTYKTKIYCHLFSSTFAS